METKELKKTFRDENIKTAGEIKAMVEKLTTRYVELDSKAFDIETKMKRDCNAGRIQSDDLRTGDLQKTNEHLGCDNQGIKGNNR